LKALLISQNITLISFPSSKAFPNSLVMTDIQSTIKLFADDTSIYLIVNDPNETADSLNNDLTKIHDWATKWLVTFNAGPQL
jgi:hypothetical protein